MRFGSHGKFKVAVLILVISATGFVGYETYVNGGLRFRAVAQSVRQYRHDLLQDEESARQIEIRSGICQFNKLGRYQDIDSFVAHWHCRSDDEGLHSSNVLVFGDSHSADKSMGLRFNGVDVVQLGGAGCSINPELARDQRSYCRRLFELIDGRTNTYDAVFLSNSFPLDEITEPNLREIFRYWSGTKKEVFIFTPMPDFTSQMRQFMDAQAVYAVPDFAREERFLAVAAAVGLPDNFRIIKTSDVWCSARQASEDHPCAFAIGDEMLMTDGGHLSVKGARIFARNMLLQPGLRRYLVAE
jgi:hypothetical protein